MKRPFAIFNTLVLSLCAVGICLAQKPSLRPSISAIPRKPSRSPAPRFERTATIRVEEDETPKKEADQSEEIRPRIRDRFWAWPKNPMDSETFTLLERMANAYKQAETLQYTETLTLNPKAGAKATKVVIRFWGKRPNLARVEISTPNPEEDGVLVCDGKTVWEHCPRKNLYMRTAAPNGPLIIQGELGALTQVAGPSLLFYPDPYMSLTRGSVTMTSRPSRNGRETIVTRVLENSRFMVVWVDNRDFLSRRYRMYRIRNGVVEEQMRHERSEIRINDTIPDALFAFAPPKEAKRYTPPSPETLLLKPGTLAPKTECLDRKGKLKTLSGLKGKPTLVAFWAEWLPVSTRALKSLENLVREYKDEVYFVALNVWDEPDALERYLRENSETPWTLWREPVQSKEASPIYEKFGVRGLPTLYLLDKEGKVLKAWIGFDEDRLGEIRTELGRL